MPQPTPYPTAPQHLIKHCRSLTFCMPDHHERAVAAHPLTKVFEPYSHRYLTLTNVPVLQACDERRSSSRRNCSHVQCMHATIPLFALALFAEYPTCFWWVHPTRMAFFPSAG